MKSREKGGRKAGSKSGRGRSRGSPSVESVEIPMLLDLIAIMFG